MKLKIALFICILSSVAWSKSSTFCSSESLLTAEGPYPLSTSPNEVGDIKSHQFLFENKGKTTALKYHLAKALSEPKKGTMIYLCGGPGSPCAKRPFGLPENYDIVTIHYLGIGDNRSLNKPEEMSIDSQGEAVAQLINHLAKPDVLIFGHSYGTAVATVAVSKFTHQIPEKKKSILQGVLLAGVVGPSAGAVYGQKYPQVAEESWQLLSANEQKRFRSKYLKVSKSLTVAKKATLDKILSSPLIYGPKTTADILKSFIKTPKDFIQDPISQKLQPEVKEAIWQQRAAACELFETVAELKKIKVFGGLVTPDTFSPEICNCRLLPARWNPDLYQIKDVPVMYLNGTSDPATPIEGAKQHFEGQKQTKEKMLLAEPNGGHGEFMIEGGKSKNCLPIFLEHLTTNNLKHIKENQDLYMTKGCPAPPVLKNLIPFEGDITK